MIIMQVIDIKAQSVFFQDDYILLLERNPQKSFLVLYRLNKNLEISEKVKLFEGLNGSLLAHFSDTFYISVDNKVYGSKDLVDWKEILKVKSGNRIWHICQTNFGVLAQEYGETPTYIYLLQDFHAPSLILSNTKVDQGSTHFHSIAYDPDRGVVYGTLGDRNLVRAFEINKINPVNWKKIYSGPWQFAPISISPNYIVFGFDSAIAKGGIGIYHPNDDKWNFLFLKYDNARLAQFLDIKQVNGLWIGVLAYMRAVVISKDLIHWYLVCVGENGSGQDIQIDTNQSHIAIATGKSLVLKDENDIKKAFEKKPIIEPYMALMDVTRGVGFVLRRYLGKIFTKV